MCKWHIAQLLLVACQCVSSVSVSQQCLPSSPSPPPPSLPPCCVQLVRNVLTVDYHMSRYKTVVEELQREIAELKTRLAQQGPLKSQFDKTEAAR